jgi:hypothetical protein
VPKVLISVSSKWHAPLAESVLWRSDVERFTAPDLAATLSMARALKPRLVVLDGSDPETVNMLRRLRDNADTRSASLAVLAHAPSTMEKETLGEAGANAVLTDDEDGAFWDDRFDELLGVPPRREVRVPVAITIWSRREAGTGADVVGVSVNLSVSGLLIETRAPMPVGTNLNLSFRLPTAPDELRLTGRVVWTTPAEGGQSRSGVEFLGFHGRAMEAILSFGAHSNQTT